MSLRRVAVALLVPLSIALVARWVQLDRAVDGAGRSLHEYVGGYMIRSDPSRLHGKFPNVPYQVWFDERDGRLYGAGIGTKFRPCLTAQASEGGMSLKNGLPSDYLEGPEYRARALLSSESVSMDGDSLVSHAPGGWTGDRMSSSVDPGKMYGIEGQGLRVYSCEPTLWQQVRLFFTFD